MVTGWTGKSVFKIQNYTFLLFPNLTSGFTNCCSAFLVPNSLYLFEMTIMNRKFRLFSHFEIYNYEVNYFGNHTPTFFPERKQVVLGLCEVSTCEHKVSEPNFVFGRNSLKNEFKFGKSPNLEKTFGGSRL